MAIILLCRLSILEFLTWLEIGRVVVLVADIDGNLDLGAPGSEGLGRLPDPDLQFDPLHLFPVQVLGVLQREQAGLGVDGEGVRGVVEGVFKLAMLALKKNVNERPILSVSKSNLVFVRCQKFHNFESLGQILN